MSKTTWVGIELPQDTNRAVEQAAKDDGRSKRIECVKLIEEALQAREAAKEKA